MSINELQDEVITEFSDFDDWMDRYQLLIDLGNEQEPLDEKYKTEQNLIEGCQSRVWLQADEEDGKIIFKAESDAWHNQRFVDKRENVEECFLTAAFFCVYTGRWKKRRTRFYGKGGHENAFGKKR